MSKKTILITGGTGGIGSSLVKLLDQVSWNIAITGQKNSTRIQDMKEKYDIKHAYEWDASDAQGISEIVNNVQDDYGTINYLVNCVGMVDSTPFMEVKGSLLLREYEINVLSAIHACQAVIPGMLISESISKIINLSSLRGESHLASTRSITYSMSKAAINTLTAALAKKYEPKIHINAIAPGFTVTPMSEKWAQSTWDQAKKSTLLGRPAESKEIAEFINFMISDKCTYLSGQTILVDGGFSISGK